uniref:Ion transport domain-containing protein n=1 Tax=Sexangularia sp. CB-2014 TaxID=1486929 RepID=A0A7S1V662_9EUKA
MSPDEWPEAVAAVASVTALFWWFQLTEYIGSFERTAPVVRVFWASAKALTSLMAVLVALMLAFATAFKALRGPTGSFGSLSIDVLSVVTMGDATITAVTGMELAVSIALIFVGAIVFVNVVIATLTNEYHNVMKDTQRAFLVERAANLGKVLRVTVSTSTWTGDGPRAEGLGQRLLFPRDRGLKGIIGASPLLFRYPKMPHSLGLLYYWELASDSDRSTSRTWAT